MASPPAEIQALPMSAAEARQAVEAIKGHINEARRLIYDLRQREGWKALGYDSWRECVAAEFEQSQAYLYRQYQAAEIEAVISPIGEIGLIPEGRLRPLAPLRDHPRELKEAWSVANELTDDKPTAKAVAKAVDIVIAARPPVPSQPSLAGLESEPAPDRAGIEDNPSLAVEPPPAPLPGQAALPLTAPPAFDPEEQWERVERAVRKLLDGVPEGARPYFVVKLRSLANAMVRETPGIVDRSQESLV